jgi:hypothetical protein
VAKNADSDNCASLIVAVLAMVSVKAGMWVMRQSSKEIRGSVLDPEHKTSPGAIM